MPHDSHDSYEPFFKKYISEVFEALVSVLIISLVTQKEYDIWNIVKLSFLIGTITYFIEYYDHEFKQTIKRGMTMSVGGAILPK